LVGIELHLEDKRIRHLLEEQSRAVVITLSFDLVPDLTHLSRWWRRLIKGCLGGPTVLTLTTFCVEWVVAVEAFRAIKTRFDGSCSHSLDDGVGHYFNPSIDELPPLSTGKGSR